MLRTGTNPTISKNNTEKMREWWGLLNNHYWPYIEFSRGYCLLSFFSKYTNDNFNIQGAWYSTSLCSSFTRSSLITTCRRGLILDWTMKNVTITQWCYYLNTMADIMVILFEYYGWHNGHVICNNQPLYVHACLVWDVHTQLTHDDVNRYNVHPLLICK